MYWAVLAPACGGYSLLTFRGFPWSRLVVDELQVACGLVFIPQGCQAVPSGIYWSQDRGQRMMVERRERSETEQHLSLPLTFHLPKETIQPSLSLLGLRHRQKSSLSIVPCQRPGSGLSLQNPGSGLSLQNRPRELCHAFSAKNSLPSKYLCLSS